MSEEESFTPASRLNSDSATSPTWAATATTTPTVTSCQTSSRNATRSSTSGPYASPAAPAHVFRGDNTGASFGPPTSVPAAIAHVSHTQVTTSGNTTSATEPRGWASLCGPWRIATTNDNRAAADRPPDTVTATAVRGRWSGPRAAPTTSTTSSQMAPT